MLDGGNQKLVIVHKVRWNKVEDTKIRKNVKEIGERKRHGQQ